MEPWLRNVIWLSVAVLLVAINGFFVAAEFALVKLRMTRLDELVREKRAFARTTRWLADRLNEALSACQLGITMASLALGWVGEPAVARLLEPLFEMAGITSVAVIHALSFAIGFTAITAAHLVIGEQAPKIFAIREPERMALWCAMPLKIFYVMTYPLLVGLSGATNVILKWVGVDATSEHDAPHTEQELRLLLASAKSQGEITRSEHRLIDAIFEFDDTICRQIMVPRNDVQFLDVEAPLAELLEQVKRSRHTRHPLCERSMDNVLGVIHLKDMVGLDPDSGFDLRTVTRPPRYVPETMLISKLLGHFQAARQHMAFVVDEHGAVVGIVTLENVLERIVGAVQDEFDAEPPDVVPDGPDRFIVQGSSPIDIVSRSIGLDLTSDEMDTMSGLLMERLGRIVEVGDVVELDGVRAEVIEVSGTRAVRIRMIRTPPPDAE